MWVGVVGVVGLAIGDLSRKSGDIPIRRPITTEAYNDHYNMLLDSDP